MAERLARVAAGFPDLDGDHLLFNWHPQDLTGSEGSMKFARLCRDNLITFVVLDPVVRFFRGDENSAADVAAFVNRLAVVRRERGASILLVHRASRVCPQSGCGQRGWEQQRSRR